MPAISGYTPPAFDATHYTKSTLNRVDAAELRLETVRSAFESLTLIKGDQGEAFKVDLFGTVAEILAKKATMTPTPEDVFYAVITDDTPSRALFSGIETSTKLDLSRHAIVFNGTVWADMGPFTGAKGEPGNNASATADIQALQTNVINPIIANVSTLISDMTAVEVGVSALEVTVNTATTGLTDKVSLLRTDLDSAVLTNVSQGLSIAAVEGRASTLETGLAAAVVVNGTQTTTITGLRTDLDSAVLTNVSQGLSIAAVEGRASTLETGLAAAVVVNGTQDTAITGLRTDLDLAVLTNVSQGLSIAAVEGRASTLETGLAAAVVVNGTQTTTITGLRTDLDLAVLTNVSQGLSIAAVEGRASTLETGLAAAVVVNGTQTTTITGLRTDLDSAVLTNVSQGLSIAAVEGRAFTLETDLAAAVLVNGTQDTAITGLRTDLDLAVLTNVSQGLSIAAVEGRASTLETGLAAAVLVNGTQTTAITKLEENSSNYLLVEGESDAGNQVLWASGASAPIVDRFGIPVPYKAILYRSSGISYGSHGTLTRMTVDVNNYGLTGSATLLKTLEFSLVSGGFMTFKEASAKSLANLVANGGNFLSFGNVKGYNSSEEEIPVPANLRFRITLEVFKDEQVSGFSLAL